MNPVPDIVLIVLAFNHARYLPQLFESIERNRADLRELVLIDNGSSDDTPARLQAFAEQARAAGLAVVVQTNPPRSGVAWALNRGLAASGAPLVAVISADDYLLPDRFGAQLAMLAAEPTTRFVYSNALVCDDAGVLTSTPAHDAGTLAMFPSRPGARRPSLFYPVPALMTHCALFRRDALEAIGGWDEGLAIDDWPLNINLLARFPDGARYLPGFVAVYRRHASNVSKRRFRQYIGQKRVVQKLARGREKARALCALYAAQALVSLKRRQGWRTRVFSRAALHSSPGGLFILHWLFHEFRRRVTNPIR